MVVTGEVNPSVAARAWRMVFPSVEDKVSTAYPEDKFSMYKVCFKEVRFCLPFTEL